MFSIFITSGPGNAATLVIPKRRPTIVPQKNCKINEKIAKKSTFHSIHIKIL
jgi:hypothetical protein